MGTIKVLVVDDSAFVRNSLSRFFKAEGLEVVGTAADPYAARDLIVRHEPDILTLDLDMPRMDGLTFLERLMAHHPMPVIVLSAFTEAHSAAALRALELGAVEVLEKPTPGNFGPLMYRLVRVLRESAGAKPRRRTFPQAPCPKGKPGNIPSPVVVALGASTGGTDALAEILTLLPPDHPGLVIVQHMPPVFTRDFAARLDRECRIHVREAREGDTVTDGSALVAPGDRHLLLDWHQGRFRVSCQEGPLVNHSRPSVDVLFHSVARAAGPRAVGVILTGMGHDGAGGLLAMREAGAATLAQDEATSVVYGMPKEAVARGAVEEVVPLYAIAAAIQARAAERTPKKEGETHGKP